VRPGQHDRLESHESVRFELDPRTRVEKYATGYADTVADGETGRTQDAHTGADDDIVGDVGAGSSQYGRPHRRTDP
jgi:hypothetical protein